jgi:ATP/ADP translocase
MVIYPNVGTLHPHAFVDGIAAMLPAGFSAPLSIIRNWSYAVFYVMAEMWGSVVASLLFWSFANEVTTVDEAKKYCKSVYMRHYLYTIHLALLINHFENRPSLWYGSKRRSHLFGAICEMGFKVESKSCSWS